MTVYLLLKLYNKFNRINKLYNPKIIKFIFKYNLINLINIPKTIKLNRRVNYHG